MTNRSMVKPDAKPEPRNREPNAVPLPAPEDSRSPTTLDEPMDSPQPNADWERTPPPEGEIGLTTKR